MDVEIDYYGDGEWISLSNYLKQFHIEDHGISRAPYGTINFETARSNLDTFIAEPYKLIRAKICPAADTWQTIFYGYVDNMHLKTVAGTITARAKMSLDVFGYAARLTSDYITWDYYKVNSALLPSGYALTWRNVIEDFLDNPDSTCDDTGLEGTGFEVVSAEDTDPGGIDTIIDSSCSFDRQTLLEALRTIADHIGLDGYFSIQDKIDFVPNILLYKSSSASSSGTISDPFIGEPEYESGSLNDTATVVFITGGVDAGIPADGDRFTEHGVTKYSPAAWASYIYNAAGAFVDYGTLTDEDNTVFTEELRCNSKCVKNSITNVTASKMHTDFDLAKAGYAVADCKNRLVTLSYGIKLFCSPTWSKLQFIRTRLIDTSANIIIYQTPYSGNQGAFDNSDEKLITVPLGEGNIIAADFSAAIFNRWCFAPGYSTFDWENVQVVSIETDWSYNSTTDKTWGMYIDGLRFVGGYSIEPFKPYSATLNPPAVSTSGISSSGIHALHYQNSLLSSFEQARAEGARVLANLSAPIPSLTCIKNADQLTKQWHPSNVCTVDSVDRRIASMIYDWQSKTKRCDCTFKFVSKTAPLPPVWTMNNELRFLVK
jgi:hypothetical protein